MNKIDVGSWGEFEDRLQELKKKLQSKKSTTMQVPPLLYRGQGDGSWPLFTTLERELQAIDNITFSWYYRLITRIKPQIESFTGTHWNVREYPLYKKWAKEKNISTILNELGHSRSVEEYRYMTFLRHHGFPSPLLDWSRSPYVAAYFAFANIRKIPNDSMPDRVSIYVYWESPEDYKSSLHSIDNPYIYTPWGSMFEPINGIFFSRVSTQFASPTLKKTANGGMLCMMKHSFALIIIKMSCGNTPFHQRNG